MLLPRPTHGAKMPACPLNPKTPSFLANEWARLLSSPLTPFSFSHRFVNHFSFQVLKSSHDGWDATVTVALSAALIAVFHNSGRRKKARVDQWGYRSDTLCFYFCFTSSSLSLTSCIITLAFLSFSFLLSLLSSTSGRSVTHSINFRSGLEIIWAVFEINKLSVTELNYIKIKKIPVTPKLYTPATQGGLQGVSMSVPTSDTISSKKRIFEVSTTLRPTGFEAKR